MTVEVFVVGGRVGILKESVVDEEATPVVVPSVEVPVEIVATVVDGVSVVDW